MIPTDDPLVYFLELKDLTGEQSNMIDLLVDSKLCSSRGDAKQMIKSGAVRLLQKKINDPNYVLLDTDFIWRLNESIVFTQLWRGKKNFALLVFKQDEDLTGSECMNKIVNIIANHVK